MTELYKKCEECGRYVFHTKLEAHKKLHSTNQYKPVKINNQLFVVIRNALEALHGDQTKTKERSYYLCDALEHQYQGLEQSCGFRNIQMAISNLLTNFSVVKDTIPSVTTIEKMIEAAWSKGFDVEGGTEIYNNKLVGLRKWIGATECSTFFNYLGIKNQIYDFDGTKHENILLHLYEFVWDYFQNCYESKKKTENVPPLYLQYSSHSLTIIGIEKIGNKASDYNLIVYNSLKETNYLIRSASQLYLDPFRKSMDFLGTIKQFQIVQLYSTPWTQEEREKSKIISSKLVPPDENSEESESESEKEKEEVEENENEKEKEEEKENEKEQEEEDIENEKEENKINEEKN
ncbi:zinc finger-containing ubiquitin peptidase [Anaeramoeba flamelloides]|uniref:Zinc finger-containing ubiquitin peptidase n=1 Tax=Anaeramoeba flamelloides TaxID=1746091 RepID=A0AAV7Z9L2_9EUKA|nr:zinc finger-containing ubiquitin peptidase [Anaeramoeba flamelloides]